MKTFLLITILLFSNSCSSSPSRQQQIDKNTYYRHDLCFTYETGKVVPGKLKNFFQRFKKKKYREYKNINETIRFCGTAVLPDLEKYNMVIDSHAKIDFFVSKSCHEENTSENPNKGLFKKKDKFYLEYSPTVEKGKTCPLYLGAYSRRSKFGTALIAFESPRFKLPAIVECNGNTEHYNGVSICQSREGLIQQITFQEPVLIEKPVKGPAVRPEGMIPCPALKLSKDQKSVKIFKIPPRECIYFFGGIKSKSFINFIQLGMKT
jgi:hypothetical protein